MVCKVIFIVIFALLVLAAKLLRCMWKEMKEQERELLKLRKELGRVVDRNCDLVLQRDSWKAMFLNTKEDLNKLLTKRF